MTARPVINLEWEGTDRITEYLSWLSLMLMWGFTLLYYPDLPDSIPIHYNTAGEADGFGDKNFIFAGPTITTVLFTFMTILNRYPHKFNYTVPITLDNAAKQYRVATKMIRWLKLLLILIFSYVQFITIKFSASEKTNLGWWFLPITTGLFFVPVLYSLLKTSVKK